jgi:hypothetical protein
LTTKKLKKGMNVSRMIKKYVKNLYYKSVISTQKNSGFSAGGIKAKDIAFTHWKKRESRTFCAVK